MTRHLLKPVWVRLRQVVGFRSCLSLPPLRGRLTKIRRVRRSPTRSVFSFFLRHAPRVSCLALTLGLTGPPAFAQSSSAGVGRFEISAGIIRVGQASFGGRDAEETAGTGTGRFRLFSSSTELTAVSGFGARFGVTLIRSLDAEISGTYGTSDLRTRIEADAETSNAPIVVMVPVQQFTVAGAAVWYPGVPRAGSRTRFFVKGGAGLERHLEDRGSRVVEGRMFEVGGGVKYTFASRSRGWWRGLGARLDALALVHARAVAVDDRAHASPAVGASVYLRF